MVNRVLSRVINMNSYKIKKDNVIETFQIKENDIIKIDSRSWKIDHLIYFKHSWDLNVISKQSFNRTKKWLIENHPELLI